MTPWQSTSGMSTLIAAPFSPGEILPLLYLDRSDPYSTTDLPGPNLDFVLPGHQAVEGHKCGWIGRVNVRRRDTLGSFILTEPCALYRKSPAKPGTDRVYLSELSALCLLLVSALEAHDSTIKMVRYSLTAAQPSD